jgi:hypothetical protein
VRQQLFARRQPRRQPHASAVLSKAVGALSLPNHRTVFWERLASLVEPTLSATAIALVCRAAGPIGVLKRVSPAESTIAPKRGHALIEGIKPAIRSAPSVAVLSTPRRSRGCVGA